MKDDLKTKILQHDGVTPRYTSYPTAPFFQQPFPVMQYTNWLATCGQEDISLYIHIPFCSKLCYYCGCHTHITQKEDRVDQYIAVLLKEATLVATHLPSGCRVTHIHFGGGSPTMLSPASFTHLMDRLRQIFNIHDDVDIALEADPRQMSEARIATYARNGVTRISLGAQDFNPDVLVNVNRPQPFHLTYDAIRWCHEYGIERINLDLMYGLPGQSVDTIAQTCEIATVLDPDRIAFFGYAHVPWMKKHMDLLGISTLPDSSLRYDLFNTGKDIFLKAGYRAIGFDHFVHEDDPMYLALENHSLHRNFQGYTADSASVLIGLGASAIGSFPQGYLQNTTDLRLYADTIEKGQLPVAKGLERSSGDIIHGQIIEELMCYMRVDLEGFQKHYHLPEGYFDASLARLMPLVSAGLVRVSGKAIIINDNARQIARVAARSFDQYANLETTEKRHSRTV